MKKQFKTQIYYSKNASWLLEMYRKCLKLDFELTDEISEWTKGDTASINVAEDFAEGYELLLKAAVCKLGGHHGHYVYILGTNLIDLLIKEQVNYASLISSIHKIIKSDDIEGVDASIISSSEAIRIAQVGTITFKNYMSDFLTTITGSKESIPFYRCDDILFELESYSQGDEPI